MTASSSKDSPSGKSAPLSLGAAVRHLLALDDATERAAWITTCLTFLPADELLPFLVSESERLLNTDPHGKLRIAEALILASEVAERPDFRGLGLLAKGDAYRVLGRYQDSVDAMDVAGAWFRSIGDEVGWARSRSGWLWSSHNLGRGKTALSIVESAFATLIEHGNLNKAASLSLHAGWVSFELGRYDDALRHYARARDLWEQCGPMFEADVARVKMNTAMLLTDLGDFQAALRLYDEARAVCARHGETVSLLRQEQNVGNVYAAQGHYTRALRHYADAFTAYETAHLENDAAIVAVRMVACYLNLNRYAEALELAEETVARFERLGNSTDAAKARFYAALALARLGQSDRALQTLSAAADTFAATGLTTEQALVGLQRATLLLDDEEWADAMHEADRAAALFRARGLVIRAAQADLVHARAALALGHLPAADALATAVLRTSEDLDVRWLAHEAHHVRGAVARARDDLPAALDAYDRAVRSLETVQSALAVELRTDFLDDKVGVYADAITTSLHLGRPAQAYAYLERAKSRALVDYLTGNLDIHIQPRDSVDAGLLDTLARLREEHNGLYNRLYGYEFAQHDAPGATRNDDALRAAIHDRERQIARVLERLALNRDDGFAAGVVVPPAPPRLAGDTVLLEYFFRDDGGVAFVVTDSGPTVVPIAVRPREIERLLQQWRLNLETTAETVARGESLAALGRNARGILAALYRALIAPVAPNVMGRDRLIVIPYGPTHAVPFHALFDGTAYLLEMLEVSVAPSAGVLRLCQDRPRRGDARALVLGYSDGGRLPAVREEARAVAALLPGDCFIEEAATRANLLAAAPRADILHLATHGEARLDNPTFAHLKLADGHLNVVDVFNLRLHGALVTLSACETGRSAVTGGDELIGLSRGFLYAGVSTIVQSLWRVEDGSTAALMTAFYRALVGGAAPGAALRTAQRTLLADAGAHPFHWAPFQLIGDSGPR